jgi:K+-transporting ATPase ATPase A chain
MAFIFMIGYYLNHHKFSRMLFTIMTAGFILVMIPILWQEVSGNKITEQMGVDTSAGNMEGKEVRFGSFYSAYYAAENAAVPAGTNVSVPDSFMPLSGAAMIAAMNIDAFFGGVGTGWINMFLFLVISVFIATLMIGRTPEIFAKKIEIRETQLAAGVVVLQTFIPLTFTAIACFIYHNYNGNNDSLAWLSNKGQHGFTTMLYEYFSSAAGNGSEFSGLNSNTAYWNLTTSIVMLCGRFAPITGALAIAGLLRKKQWIAPSPGSLSADSNTFGLFLFAVIIAINGLSLMVVLILGPIAEYALLK